MDTLEKAREEINRIDREMAYLFEKRMKTAGTIADYKREHELEIFDPDRERAVIERNQALVKDPRIRLFYVRFLKETMKISRSYQHLILDGDGRSPVPEEEE